MILLWGIETDDPLARVKAALEERGAPVFFLDQQLVLDTRIEFVSDGELTGTIDCGGTGVELESITGCYFRPYDIRRMRAVESNPDGSAKLHAIQIEDAMTAWS